MALTWKWSEPCGITYMKGTDEKYHYHRLWKGNAELIAMYPKFVDRHCEWNLTWFFCDIPHMKNCLGLSKGYKNIFEKDSFKSFILFYDRCNAYKIAELLQKAFPDVSIYISKSYDLTWYVEKEGSCDK